MASLLRNHPELRMFQLQNVRLTGTRIGSGSYGSVEEGEIPGAVCAVKKIHDIFQDRSAIPEAQMQRAASQFVEECRLMSTLRHPHIVLFLGICVLPSSRLPALVMERLLTSLHDLLETRPNIPLGLKHSFLYDVAQGLCYLHSHSPPLIHRDLSAKNILLNSAMTAKIADFGVARIVPSLSVATMTKAPGASVYMPPEALEDKSRYDMTIDIFSLGVVAIFTLSQRFPDKVLAQVYRDGGQNSIRNELERRGEYMQMIYGQIHDDHPLVLMIKRCLKSFPEDRPTIHQVVQLLEQARTEIGDAECRMDRLVLVKTVKEQNQQTESHEQRFVSKNRRIEALQQELQSKEEEVLQKNHQVTSMENWNTQLVQQIESMERESTKLAHDMMLQIDGLSQENLHYKVEIDRLIKQLPPRLLPKRGLPKLKWKKRKNLLPFGVQYAHAVLLKFNEHVYIGGGQAQDGDNQYIVMKYDPVSGEWSQLPKSAVHYFGMASAGNQLLLAGGGGDNTDIQLLDGESHQSATQRYPKMPTARPSPAAVGYQHYLIVACGLQYKKNVEILNCLTHKWYSAQPIPLGGNHATAVIIGDYVYISSYAWIDGEPHVYSAHLPTLIAHAIDPTFPLISPIWQELPTPPVSEPTLLALQHHLLLIGGKGGGKEVYSYEIESKEYKGWRACGEFPVKVCAPSCVVLPSGKLLVAGGKVDGDGEYSRQVWIGSLDYTYEYEMEEMDVA